MRDDETVTTVIPRFTAMALIRFLQGMASRVMRVPVPAGFPRIQNIDRNILVDGRQARLPDAAPSLRSTRVPMLPRTTSPSPSRPRNDPGIGGHQPVDVGPDLNFFGIQRGTRQWRRCSRMRLVRELS